MGALRSSAQIISYEIPMGMSILGVVILSGSLNLERIIGAQLDHGWNIVYQPLACLLFLTSIFAECNRLPFDLPEAEQELVGGYHTEYSAMKFALFFLGEYTHMISTSFLFVILFFGGWHFPWIAEPTSPWVVKLIVFAVKMFLVILFYMLVRWTIPRFRFDQLMGMAWKVLIPLALVNVLVVMVVKQLAVMNGWANWVQAVVLCIASVVLLVATGALTLLRRQPLAA
jgi:NADH-quinone oxidoreductase subunit H